MSSIGAAPRAAASLSPARAEASRRNGAKSRGPKTPEGKARSAQNALKHGLRAQKHRVLPGEDDAEFAALEAALMEELAPEGALQAALAQRVVSAVWRLSRAERLEAELFARNHLAGGSLGLALIRDCNGARSFDTLLRYRGGTLAELWRALRTLKALQAEQAATPRAPAAGLPPPLMIEPNAGRTRGIEMVQDREAAEARPHAQPIEPETRENPADFAPALAGEEPARRPREPLRSPGNESELLAVALAGLLRPAEAPAQAGGTAPGAIAPPREHRHGAASPPQPSRSTP